MRHLIDKLKETRNLNKEEWQSLLEWGRNLAEEEISAPESDARYLFDQARQVKESVYGKKVYIRGLIEFTNYCKNDCYYCGIRKSNEKASRYRLTKEEILSCCRAGWEAGFRTFVLQGGEDGYFTDERVCDIVREIKEEFPSCAVTLSIGEREQKSYEAFRRAGADRYLLRHETADPAHYRYLHPEKMSQSHRKNCLYQLKELGFQTGCGIMAGSPGQTTDCLWQDMMFMKELNPEMVGIGPFIPQHDTPFGGEPRGSLALSLFLVSVTRLMLPLALIPATTALGTIHPEGREMGILAGANVVMPNLSPESAREKYTLYDNKIHTGGEAAEGLSILKEKMEKIGCYVAVDRGDAAACAVR